MQITFRQLQYFVEIVDAGNMARAADHLHVAPTALSHQVKILEDHLGRVLLLRHSRGVSPTRKGIELYERGREILSMIKETEKLFVRADSTRETWQIGVAPSIANIAGYDLATIPKARAASPTIALVEDRSKSLQARLLDRSIDLLLSGELEPHRSIRSVEFLRERLVFARANAAMRSSRPIPLKDVLASDLVVFGEDGTVDRIIHRAAKAAGLACRKPRVVEALDVIRQLIIHGTNTAVLPFGLVKEDVRHGTISVAEISDYPLVRAISLSGTPNGIARAKSVGVFDQLVALVTSVHLRAGPYFEPIAITSDVPGKR